MIQEAFTPQQIEQFTSMGIDVVENKTIGMYDVALLSGDLYQEHFGTPYTIGFQRQGRNAISYEEQMGQAPSIVSPDKFSLLDMKEVLNTIIRWRKRYGVMVIGSYNPRNTQIYARVFRRFNIPFSTERKFDQDILRML